MYKNLTTPVSMCDSGEMASKRKRVDLPLDVSVELIEWLKKGRSQRTTAEQFKCSKGQVQRTLENQEQILREYVRFSGSSKRKRPRPLRLEGVD
jgi:hypothetical protein